MSYIKNNKKSRKVDSSQYKIPNTQKTWYHISIIMTIIFSISFLSGLVFYDLISDFAGALSMISLLIAMTSFIFIFITRKGSMALERAINLDEYIAKWSYTKSEWQEFLKNERIERDGERTIMFFFLSAFTAIIFIIFILLIPEGQIEMLFVLFILISLYGFMAFVFPRIGYFFRNTGPAVVMILNNGILLDKQFHTWDFPLSGFLSATVDKKPFPHLAISYRFTDRTGPRSYTVLVPIPKSISMHEAKKVAKELRAANSRKG